MLVFAHTRRVASRASRLPSRRVSRDVPPHPPPRASGARTPRRARRRRAGARPRRGGTRGRPPRPRTPRRTGPARCPAPGARAGGPTRWGPRTRVSRVTRRARVSRTRATPAVASPRARRAPARETDKPSRVGGVSRRFDPVPLFLPRASGVAISRACFPLSSVREDFRFFRGSSAFLESQTVVTFFRHVRSPKNRGSRRHKSPPAHLELTGALPILINVTGLARSKVRLGRAAFIRDTASPNEQQQNPRPRAMSSTWAQ